MVGGQGKSLSLVVVNFNGGALVSASVAAALACPAADEVVLVDNGSTDGSLDALREAAASNPRLRLVEAGSNLGFARAVNRGLALAEGRLLLLLNPDCLVGQAALERVVAALDRDPSAGMAGCRILNPDGTEQRGCRRTLPRLGSGLRRAFGLERPNADPGGGGGFDLHRGALPRGVTPVEAISGAFMMVKREALRAVGPLDEGYFLHCEDLDWCRRFEDAGWRILFVPDASVIHHQGTCSRSRPIRVSWHKHRGMIRYYRKFLRRENGPLVSLLVYGGVAARFLALAALDLVRRVLPSFGPRPS